MSCFGYEIYDIIETTKKAINGEIFMKFLMKVIERIPEEAILYLDNCPYHKIRAVRILLENHGVQYTFSSPYSPDYNPIEWSYAFIKLKVKERSGLTVSQAITYAIDQITEDHCKSWIDCAVSNWMSNKL